MITTLKSSEKISNISKSKQTFDALLILVILLICILPKQTKADIVGFSSINEIQTYNESDWTPVSLPASLSMTGYDFVQGWDITWNSDNLSMYAIVQVASEYHLVTVDPGSGVCTDIGNMGLGYYFYLAYSSTTGTLYAVGVDTSNSVHLYTVDILTGSASPVAGPFTNIGDIAYNYDDGFLYSFTYNANVHAPLIYKINTTTYEVTEIPPSGGTYNLIYGVYYKGGGVFEATNIQPFVSDTSKVLSITSAGAVSVKLTSTTGAYSIQGLGYADPLLPVELTSFISLISNNNVTLNWATSSETNNSGFDIERANIINQTSGEWIKIANVQGNGTSTAGHNYSFIDKNLPSGKYNYRLKQTDYNGSFEYFTLNHEVNVGIPSEYDLSQNYPNPFNPSTSINYEIPFDGKVSLKIFDMSGKEVSTIVDEVKTAGFYTVNFNAPGLTSGIYFYTINAGDYSASKKLMLVK